MLADQADGDRPRGADPGAGAEGPRRHQDHRPGQRRAEVLPGLRGGTQRVRRASQHPRGHLGSVRDDADHFDSRVRRRQQPRRQQLRGQPRGGFDRPDQRPGPARSAASGGDLRRSAHAVPPHAAQLLLLRQGLQRRRIGLHLHRRAMRQRQRGGLVPGGVHAGSGRRHGRVLQPEPVLCRQLSRGGGRRGQLPLHRAGRRADHRGGAQRPHHVHRHPVGGRSGNRADRAAAGRTAGAGDPQHRPQRGLQRPGRRPADAVPARSGPVLPRPERHHAAAAHAEHLSLHQQRRGRAGLPEQAAAPALLRRSRPATCRRRRTPRRWRAASRCPSIRRRVPSTW